MLTALVEEAVSVGDLVRLMRFMQGQASLVELTLAEDSPLAGCPISDVELPPDSALVAILREGRVVLPSLEGTLEVGDEILAVATSPETESQLARLLGSESTGGEGPGGTGSDGSDPTGTDSGGAGAASVGL
jgi:trk system potassium uptake protein TrkA